MRTESICREIQRPEIGFVSSSRLASNLGKAGFCFPDCFINCLDRPSISYQIPEGSIAREVAPQLHPFVHFTLHEERYKRCASNTYQECWLPIPLAADFLSTIAVDGVFRAALLGGASSTNVPISRSSS
jgi:hypothetical protein